jgi:hypothetical protein
MRHGWQEKRVIHPFFGTREYQRFGFPEQCDRGQFNQRLLAALESPALSLMQPLFDPSHYLQSLGSDEGSDTPLQHFLTSGWRQHASAFPLFDEAFFLSQGPGIRDASNPYVEYLSDFSHSFSPSQFWIRLSTGDLRLSIPASKVHCWSTSCNLVRPTALGLIECS